MVQAGQVRGIWRSVRDLPGRTPLRIKLITALLALVAIALAVTSIAGIVILRNDLLGPVDNTLTSPLVFSRAVGDIVNYQQSGQTFPDSEVALDWISNGAAHRVGIPTAAYASGLNGHIGSGDLRGGNVALGDSHAL